MPIQRYSDYDPFAWLYDRQQWGEQFLPAALAVIEKLVLPELPAGASILDLCCGTGLLARVLAERGYRVAGLDGSAEMLRFARENAPGIEFILDDARTFATKQRYDAVVSVFDSLNHILSLDELTDAFRCVRRALTGSGVFLFDVNMAPGLADWKGTRGIIEDDHVCVIDLSYDPAAWLARFEATLFCLDAGEWRRTDFALSQKAYSEAELTGALKTAGFAIVSAFSFTMNEGLRPLSAEAGRAFFLCRK
jgi:SAM-dependent methyltransferase